MERGYAAYKQVSLETASKPQLLLALYDGAIRFLGQAETAIAKADVEAANNNIGRTQDIVGELMGTLDMSQGEVPQQLMDLYIYMHGALVAANMQKDVEKLREVSGLLQQLRTAWREAITQLQNDAGTAAGG